MSNSVLTRAEEFMWKNARLLERRRFSYHFKGGSRGSVIEALRAYQNDDGGFGNALEPDIRCPDSQPVPVQHAIEFLDEVGFDEALVQQACDWLMMNTTAEGGVPWLLPSALAYPRAWWWNCEENPVASLNPTAAIAGVLHKNNFKHDWLDRAASYCWSKIADFEAAEMHQTGVVLTFLYHVPDRQRAEVEIKRIIESMLAGGLVADADDTNYVRKPLDWAPTPEHPLFNYFRQERIDANLDAIISEQQEDGGWDISFDTTTPACRLEWRGWLTLSRLQTLRAFGRV